MRQRKIWCCRAAGKPAIHAECSKSKAMNSKTADKPAARLARENVCFIAVSGHRFLKLFDRILIDKIALKARASLLDRQRFQDLRQSIPW